MRRMSPFWVVMVVMSMGASAQAKQAGPAPGFWVSLASGAAGSSSTSDYSEFWFASPHAPAIAVTSVSGTGSVTATTSGGESIFTALGTPVLLPTTNGYATLSDGAASAASSALPRFAGGSQASGPPTAGGAIPASADHLSLNLSTAVSGSQVLSVSVAGPGGQVLGQTSVSVPTGGWWLVGAGPDVSASNQTGGGGSTPVTNPGSGGGNGGTNGGTVGAPEPSSVLMAAIGGCCMTAMRRMRRN